MKARKSFKTLPYVAITLLTVGALAGCHRDDPDGGISVDDGGGTKSVLRVKYLNGGLRDEWITKVCNEFCELYKNHSFEEGKVGVTIVPEFIKSNAAASSIKNNPNDVFWAEDTDYSTCVSTGQLYDITDWLNEKVAVGPEQKEDQTILDKFTDSSKQYFAMKDSAGKDHYYAIPAYENSCFLNYNIDLFDQKCLYFAKGKTADGMSDSQLNSSAVDDLFVTSADEERSTGPDGVAGTFDDGLPATYADFHALITFMKRSSITPFIWKGNYPDDLSSFGLTAWGGSSGAETLEACLSLEGNLSDLVEWNNGSIVYDEDGVTPKHLDTTAVNSENGYLFHQSQGLLDSLKLAKLMLSNDGKDKNYYKNSMSQSFDHLTAQRYFLNGYSSGVVEQPIGILVDGCWWNSEANAYYQSDSDRLSRRMGIMPVPHPTRAQVGEPNVMVSDRQSMIFVRSTIAEKTIPVAKAFVQYLNSDVAMNTFSRYTDMMRLMKYEITDETLKGMSPYGRSVVAFSKSENTKHVNWVPMTDLAKKNASLLSYRTWGYSCSSTDINPYTYFAAHMSVTPEDYCNNVNQYYHSNWSYLLTK